MEIDIIKQQQQYIAYNFELWNHKFHSNANDTI